MKLNKECVRDFMIYIEENAPINAYIRVEEVQLQGFSVDEILYTASKLLEAEFLNGDICWDITGMPHIQVKSITWEGHEFLDNIRDNVVWKKTKNILSQFASVSISVLSTVSGQVIAQLVKNQITTIP